MEKRPGERISISLSLDDLEMVARALGADADRLDQTASPSSRRVRSLHERLTRIVENGGVAEVHSSLDADAPKSS